jgi:hypothetical protein
MKLKFGLSESPRRSIVDGGTLRKAPAFVENCRVNFNCEPVISISQIWPYWAGQS